jgi:hypothetical protein
VSVERLQKRVVASARASVSRSPHTPFSANPRTAPTVGRVDPLRHEALQARRAGSAEQSCTPCTVDVTGDPKRIVAAR